MKLESFAPVVGGKTLFPPIDLEISPGEIVTVMGRSGTGKTSMFRAMTGGCDHVGRFINDRKIWSIYQNDHQLFPWLSVATNLDVSAVQDWRPWAETWKLDHLVDKKPQYLSVGQRQRFTLLRAACSGAKLLLCDEPLSAVDGLSTIQICQDIRDMAQQLGISVLWITHSADESCAIGDHCLVITERHWQILSRPLPHDEIYQILLA